MIYIGQVKQIDDVVRVTIPALGGSSYTYIVKANPDDYNIAVDDSVALIRINGSADEFYVVGKIATTFDQVPSAYTEIATATDLNTIVANGSYIVSPNSTAATLLNVPEAKSGVLRVYKGSGATWLIQEYKVYSPGTGSGHVYSRGYNGTTWAPWRRLITSVDTFGTQGTLDTALATLRTDVNSVVTLNTAQNTRLDDIDTLNTTQNTRLTTAEGTISSHGTRITNLETFKSATKVWSAINGPSHYDVPFASITPTDVPGLTVTVPVSSTSDVYMIAITLIVEVVSTDPTDGAGGIDPVFNKMLEARLNVNGVDSAEEINFRPAAAGNPVTGTRSTLARIYTYTGLTAGNRVFKVRCNQHAVGPNTQLRVHANSTVKVLRVN